MYSIRRRLLLVLTAGFSLLIFATGAYLDHRLTNQATEEFDASLLARTRALAALTDQEGGRIELDYSPKRMPAYERVERPEYFQFWLDDGRVLLRSARLPAGVSLPFGGFDGVEGRARDIDLPDGRAGRLIQIAFTPTAGEDSDEDEPAQGSPEKARGVVVAVARGRERLDALIASMRLVLFGVGGVAVLLAVLLVWRSLQRGLRPLEEVAAQVELLNAETLDARVGVSPKPAELAPIVDQLNALLDRLDLSFERERRFAGNVAHELRTPIAELRSLSEVATRWPEDRESTVRFFSDVATIAGRMEGVIADMLLLARCQAGVEKAAEAPTCLNEVIAASWERIAPSTDLTLRVEMLREIVVRSDPGKLDIVFSNLLGNAASYGAPGSEILCAALDAEDGFRLEITNAAEPLTPEEIDRMAEPFWRADVARTASEHAGLGLSVVASLAALLGLEVRFDQSRDGAFRVRIAGWKIAKNESKLVVRNSDEIGLPRR